MQIPGTVLTYGDTVRLSVTLFNSGLLGRDIKSPEGAFAVIVTGAEMGLPAMASLRSIKMVEGKPTLAADLQLGLFKRAGGRSAWRELTDSRATLWLRHPNGDEHVESFSIEDARSAQLTGKDNWKKYPKAMLRSRVITAGLKSLGFEQMAGVYDPEELQGVGATANERAGEGEPARYAMSQSDNMDMPIPLNAAAHAEIDASFASDRTNQAEAVSDGQEMTLAEALALTLADNPTSWKGRGGDVLSTYDTDHLKELREWFEDKLREGHRDDFALRSEAITLILDDREKAQGKLELVTEPPISAAQAESDKVLGVKESEKPRPRATDRTSHEPKPGEDRVPF